MDGAGGISYFSSGSWKRPVGGVCPEAVASEAIEASKSRRLVVEAVEDLIWNYVECVVKQFPPLFALATCGGPTEAFATRDARSAIPNPLAGALPLIQNSNHVEDYLQ